MLSGGERRRLQLLSVLSKVVYIVSHIFTILH